ncbi:hypothetical protein SAMN05421747_12216 [Parapedobacter composti]|uniref:Uncharacterized protein n=1 Tax=Parapedobacter composti TaxID=623281 RepID=A0A1I1LVD5_9SPHI|nr:hypothetical protein SAMN05421747_12216 [Parapedobacter composti]
MFLFIDCLRYFNSCMVRLKVEGILAVATPYEFQFLYGAIKGPLDGK